MLVLFDKISGNKSKLKLRSFMFSTDTQSKPFAWPADCFYSNPCVKMSDETVVAEWLSNPIFILMGMPPAMQE